MNFKFLLPAVLFFLTFTNVYSQKQSFRFSANVEISNELKERFHDEGRFYLFLSQNPNAEPRTQTWPSPSNKTYIFAKNIDGFKPDDILKIGNDENWISTTNWTLD